MVHTISIRRLSFIVLLFLSVLLPTGFNAICAPIPLRYRHFNNFDGRTSSIHVRCVEKDPYGCLWMGTTNGLYSFDGYEGKKTDNPDIPTGCVNSLLKIGSDMYMGCEKGLFLFNMETRNLMPVEAIGNVGSLLSYDGDLWLSTANGVFSYSLTNKALTPVEAINSHIAPPVMSLCMAGNTLYIGTLDALAQYDLHNASFSFIKHDMPMVNSMLGHRDGKHIWIGTGSTLYLYDPAEQAFSDEARISVAKSMAYDDQDNLLIGSDHGLYILPKKGEIVCVTHDARDSYSLSSDVVWDVSDDMNGNVWLATDNGVCMSPDNSQTRLYSLPALTLSGNGNQLYSLSFTQDGTLWAGGSNGLIRLSGLETGDVNSKWYQMNDPNAFLPHNRIRKTFIDSFGRLWIASDRGLQLYDPETETFGCFLIKDSSYWVYDIGEDKDGNIWIATYSGVHCLGKDVDTWKETVAPVWSLSSADGIDSDRVSSLGFDKNDFLWMISDRTLFRVRLKDRNIERLRIKYKSQELRPGRMTVDDGGNVWATDGRLLARISTSPEGLAVRCIRLSSSGTNEILAMADIGGEIWISDPDGIYTIDKKSMRKSSVTSDSRFTSVARDPAGKIWLGGDDRLVEVKDHGILSAPDVNVRITGIKINGNETSDSSVLAQGRIELPYNENNLEISFSDMSFDETKFSTLMFRMKNSSEWIRLDAGQNKIFLPGLSPGKYQLYITPADRMETAAPLLYIDIRQPWYLSTLALCLYIAACILAVIWIIKFIMLRQRLKAERMERSRLIEQGESKINFLSNISHEFKTPLNIVTTSLSRLLKRSPNAGEKEILTQAKSNADKINSLLRMLTDAYRENEYFAPLIISSRIDIIELSTSIFEDFRSQYEEKDLELTIHLPDCPIYVYADPFKIESIIGNLLSNACKYTLPGGKVSLTLSVCGSILRIEVADTGIGIPAKEQSLIFQKFFRTQEAVDLGMDGSGIGLSTVKEYVELHNGSVYVQSDGSGSTFTVTLPIVCDADHRDCQSPVGTDADATRQTASTDERLPLVAVIDDNLSMVDFMRRLLKDKYRIVSAADGKAGLNLCLKESPDLIIADLRMPVMDGLKMCGELRRHTSMSTTPIIMLTGGRDPDTELKSMQARVDAFIEKPFDHTLLLAKIEQLLMSHDKIKQQVRIESISVSAPESSAMTIEERLLREVTRIIEQEIANPDLSVAMLSEKSGYGEKYLYRKIKLLTELSTSEYIRSIRLKKAGVFLAKGDFSVSEVMYMVGFSNASYFTRCFKKEFGCTPMEYISRHRRPK